MTTISVQAKHTLFTFTIIAILTGGLTACISDSDGTSITTTTEDSTTPESEETTDTATLGTTYDTSDVQCDWSQFYYNDDESVLMNSDSTWTCFETTRDLSANGVPDHEIGTFPNANNPNSIAVLSVEASYTLTPTINTETGTAVKEPGLALNGVKFDPGTGGRCDDTGDNCSLNGGSGTWSIEALGQSSFNFGEDMNNAHVQPGGTYHYHGMPENLMTKLNPENSMTLIGWASDGFPIYARYGYSTATDATSSIKTLSSSYQVKSTADTNRPSTDLYAMGTFTADYEYIEGSGDLDECNGRTGVTPEFPNGIYYYTVTDTFPFVQRCVKGSAEEEGGPGGPPPV